MKYIFKTLLFLLIVSRAKAQSPETTAIERKFVETVDIDISRISLPQDLPDEKSEAYGKVYYSFISTHSLNDEGEFILGGKIADDKVTQNYFKHLVSNSPISETVEVPRNCIKCKGVSTIRVPVDNNPLSLTKETVKCPACPNNGKNLTLVTYRLTCNSNRLAPLPESPRITKQRLLVKDALIKANPVSQVEYASKLEVGVLGVEKNPDLARELFAKAFVNGNGFGLDGLVRLSKNFPKGNDLELRLGYVLMLLQAKVEKGRQTADSGFTPIYPDELGVVAPRGLTYMDIKVAELVARSLNSSYKSKDINLVHLTDKGHTEALRVFKNSLKKQQPLGSASQQVEFVLMDMALAPSGEGFGHDRLGLIKQAAVSLNPVAYGILGDLCERGLLGSKNIQSASIFYTISKKLSPEKCLVNKLEELDSRYDTHKTKEMVEEFYKTKTMGRGNINYIEAVLKLEPETTK